MENDSSKCVLFVKLQQWPDAVENGGGLVILSPRVVDFVTELEIVFRWQGLLDLELQGVHKVSLQLKKLLRSPDITPLDFFIWGYVLVKDIVYRTNKDTGHC